MICPTDAPIWMHAAWKEIGTHEQHGNRGPAIRRYISLAHCGEEGEPWCAIFANAMLESSGITGTRSPSSQSFRHSGRFIPIPGPAFGAIVVYWRMSRQSGLGHVGFYVGERGNYIATLGGNEGDMVQIEPMAKVAGSFGLVGYFWPSSLPVPRVAPVQIALNAPMHQVNVT